ncbi:hypothetical protein [Novacetimonas pomaceti]|uniref:hypothetical protein n=1 Tax=Novacetimonas pomaceti TaxID=2021998 RepID=UPI0010578CA4|nr:hypothetical protein [Novacetimonas pomaceti]
MNYSYNMVHEKGRDYMIKHPTVTIILTEWRKINFYDAMCIYDEMSNKNSPINVVFFEKDENHSLRIPITDKNIVSDKKYGDEYSRNTILLDSENEITYCISVCANRQIFRHFIDLVKNSLVSENYRYIVVCRPFLIASLMPDIAHLGFIFMGSHNMEHIRQSASHILHMVNNDYRPNSQEKDQKNIKIIEEDRVVFSTELDFVSPFTLFGFTMKEGHVKEYEKYAEISNVENQFAMYGPYISLQPGPYKVGWLVSSDNTCENNSILFDVVANLSVANSVASIITGDSPQWIWLDFQVDDGNSNNVEFRIMPQTCNTFRVHKIALRSRTRVH